MTEQTMEARVDFTSNELGAKISRRIYAVALEIQHSSLPSTIQDLVELRASQINGCGWCVDVHAKEATVHGESPERLHLVAAWRHASVFTEPERAALRLAEEGTRIADAAGGVGDDTWAAVTRHFTQEQAIALIALVAIINASNRLGIISNLVGGNYQPGGFAELDAERPTAAV